MVRVNIFGVIAVIMKYIVCLIKYMDKGVIIGLMGEAMLDNGRME